jgi:hypothetical protein
MDIRRHAEKTPARLGAPQLARRPHAPRRKPAQHFRDYQRMPSATMPWSSALPAASPLTNAQRCCFPMKNASPRWSITPTGPCCFCLPARPTRPTKVGRNSSALIYNTTKNPDFKGKVIFLENYGMEMAKLLVQGVDIWLNTPTRPKEASGTSGMKAVLNGVMNFSVLDGWWCEGYRPGAGWALPEHDTYADPTCKTNWTPRRFTIPSKAISSPPTTTKTRLVVSERWVRHIKNTIADIAPEFRDETDARRLSGRATTTNFGHRSRRLKKNQFTCPARTGGVEKPRAPRLGCHRTDRPAGARYLQPFAAAGREFRGRRDPAPARTLSSSDVGVEVVFFRRRSETELDLIGTHELELDHQKGALSHLLLQHHAANGGCVRVWFPDVSQTSACWHTGRISGWCGGCDGFLVGGLEGFCLLITFDSSNKQEDESKKHAIPEPAVPPIFADRSMLSVKSEHRQRTIFPFPGRTPRLSAGTKLLILHADDLGMSHSENQASFEALVTGAVNSASIMVPCPWLPEVAFFFRDFSTADLGLHLTLTSEWKNYKWGPAAPRGTVSSLVDSIGYFHESCATLAARARPEEVELELRAQIEKAKAMGYRAHAPRQPHGLFVLYTPGIVPNLPQTRPGVSDTRNARPRYARPTPDRRRRDPDGKRCCR